MRNALLLLILLSTGVGLSAQQSSLGAPTALPILALGAGCPVNFEAHFNPQTQQHFITDQNKFSDSQLLELTFDHRNTGKILGASITVHGVSGSNSARYLLVSGQAGQNKTQTFKLDRAPKSAGLARVEIIVTKMTFVRWAEVTELRYADGSIWHPSALAKCQAMPSGFQLIN